MQILLQLNLLIALLLGSVHSVYNFEKWFYGSADIPTQGSTAEQYEIFKGKQLGKGGVGTVYLGQVKASGEFVAIKISNNKQNAAKLEKEARFHRLVQEMGAQGVVRLIDTFQLSPSQFCIVMELMSMDLSNFVQIMHHRNASSKDLIAVMKQVSRDILPVLERLHSRKFIHADLKPDNILYQNSTGRFKLGDFGLLIRPGQYKKMLPNRFAGTWPYLSPEIFAYAIYGPESDMWAFGCTLLNAYKLKTTFDVDEFTLPDIVQKWQRWLGEIPARLQIRHDLIKADFKFIPPKKPSEVSQMSNDNQIFSLFLSQLLRYDPRRRLAAIHALEHGFFVK
jgi:serine/threonine protein kinase